jgi:hypothetical protein
MRVPASFIAVVLFGAVAVPRPVLAQSLGDVAKQEEERRKDVKSSSKVYTNKDLGTPRAIFGDSSEASKTSAEPATPAPAADKGKDASKDSAKDDASTKDQKYWSTHMKELRTKLDRDKVLADAMQSRINALTADFSARADPAQRAVIDADRKRALGELDSLQKGIKDDQKAIADFEDEARRASVPPGWLR